MDRQVTALEESWAAASNGSRKRRWRSQGSRRTRRSSRERGPSLDHGASRLGPYLPRPISNIEDQSSRWTRTLTTRDGSRLLPSPGLRRPCTPIRLERRYPPPTLSPSSRPHPQQRFATSSADLPRRSPPSRARLKQHCGAEEERRSKIRRSARLSAYPTCCRDPLPPSRSASAPQVQRQRRPAASPPSSLVVVGAIVSRTQRLVLPRHRFPRLVRRDELHLLARHHLLRPYPLLVPLTSFIVRQRVSRHPRANRPPPSSPAPAPSRDPLDRRPSSLLPLRPQHLLSLPSARIGHLCSR